MQEMQETWVWSLGGEEPLGRGNGIPLQYSCQDNPVDREAWQAIVPGVAKSQTEHKHIETANNPWFCETYFKNIACHCSLIIAIAFTVIFNKYNSKRITKKKKICSLRFYSEQRMRQHRLKTGHLKMQSKASNISKVEMYPFQINARGMNLSGVLGLIFNYERIAKRIHSELFTLLWKESSCCTNQPGKANQTIVQFVPEPACGSQSAGSLSPCWFSYCQSWKSVWSIMETKSSKW